MNHRRDHEWLETFEGESADRYDRHARRLRGMHERTARRVAGLLPPGGHHLDVGSGPGTLLAAVARLRPDAAVTGVDASERMVELASERLSPVTAAGRGRVLVGDAATLPLPDASVDVATAVVTMHHWHDLTAGVAELLRVLAPGGTALVVELHGPARDVAAAFRQAGAVVVRGNAWVYGLPLLVRLAASGVRPAPPPS